VVVVGTTPALNPTGTGDGRDRIEGSDQFVLEFDLKVLIVT
jgi:hypothetical protein